MKLRVAICPLLALALATVAPGVFGQASGQSQAPPVYDFGTHDIGTKSVPIAVPLKNSTNSKVKFVVTANKESKADYQIEKNGCADEVAPNALCVVEITFSPMGEGSRSGEFLVTSQATSDGKPSSLPSVTLRGIGSLPDLDISSSQIYFSAQQAFTTSPSQTVTLTNNSQNDLTINKIVANGDFLLEAPISQQILKSKESTVAVVTFKPTQEGKASGMLTIFSSARGSPQDVYLSGSTPDLWGEFCAASPCVEVSLLLFLCLLYWVAMVIVRWNRVARPTRELLKAEINSL